MEVGRAAGPAGILANLQGELEYLLRRALVKVRFGAKSSGAMRWEGSIYDNHFRYHQRASREVAAELITHLGEIVKSLMRAGELNEPIFDMWMHAIDRNNAEARAFMTGLARSPAFTSPAFRTLGNIASILESGRDSQQDVYLPACVADHEGVRSRIRCSGTGFPLCAPAIAWPETTRLSLISARDVTSETHLWAFTHGVES